MIIILSGPVHSGKTTLLERVAFRLGKRKGKVDGYLTPSRLSRKKVKGYDLVSLLDGSRVPFLSRDALSAAGKAGPFSLDPAGLRRAEELIRKARDSARLVVDEIGPLELSGGGVRRALEKALASRPGTTLLVVRESILEEMLDALGISSAKVIDVRQPGAEETLLEWLENPQSRE